MACSKSSLTRRPRSGSAQDIRSWTMSRIKSKDTVPEMALRRRLWKEGLRYRKDVDILPGRPDILFPRRKLVVFVDGRFWHGKKLSPERLEKMPSYWKTKIRRNVARDKKNNRLLRKMGYEVLRFTDVDIARNLETIISQIKASLASIADSNHCSQP